MRFSRLTANLLGAAASVALLSITPAWAVDENVLQVGVAKVDITPSDLTHMNPMGYGTMAGVHDSLFARALVIGNGKTLVALVSLDAIETGDTLQLRERIQKELGIPVNHVFITASHSHSAPRLGKPTPGSLDKLNGPESDANTVVANDKIFNALKQAKASMQPARLGLGTGTVDINVNRDLYTAQGWREGFNPSGPSDKTLWVLKFETTSGQPIAIVFNYAVHSVATMRENSVSGDIAGAAEHYVEQRFGDKMVALWTLGPAGDQFPRVSGGGGNARPGPAASAGTTPAPAQVKGQAPSSYDAMTAGGLIIGAEVVRVANLVQPKAFMGRLEADERVFPCPLRAGIDKIATFHATDTGNVPIRIGLVLIDDIALATVSGEVVTNIYTHLKKASPLTNTIMVTLTNDRMGYIVDDASYDAATVELLASPAARGCAEDGIVNGIVDMIDHNR